MTPAQPFAGCCPSYQATERPALVLRYQLWHQPPGELGHRKIDTYSTLEEACTAAGHPDRGDWMWASGGLVVTPESRDPARGKWLISPVLLPDPGAEANTKNHM